MLYISFCELLKNWKQTLLMALQIGLIMFMTIVAVTTYREQSVKYDYLRKFLYKDGMTVYLDMMTVTTAGGIDAFFKGINAVDEYHCVREAWMSLKNEEDVRFCVYGYDELLSKYEPKLAEGKWFTEVKNDGEILEAVAARNLPGIHLGDTIELSQGEDTIKVHICGVLDEISSIYVTNSSSIFDSVFDFYANYDSNREDTRKLLLTSSKELDRLGISYSTDGRVLVSFKENATEDSKKYALSKLRYAVTLDFETLVERTEDEINRKMSEILPVFIGAFFLVLLSIASISAVDIMTSMQSYAVFFSCGMKWKKGIHINAIKSLMTCFIGVVVMFLLHYISIITKLSDTILFEFGPWQTLACVLVCVFMVAVSCIMPGHLLKNTQPVDVLRDSKE